MHFFAWLKADVPLTTAGNSNNVDWMIGCFLKDLLMLSSTVNCSNVRESGTGSYINQNYAQVHLTTKPMDGINISIHRWKSSHCRLNKYLPFVLFILFFTNVLIKVCCWWMKSEGKWNVTEVCKSVTNQRRGKRQKGGYEMTSWWNEVTPAIHGLLVTLSSPQPEAARGLHNSTGRPQQTCYVFGLFTPLSVGPHRFNSHVFICNNE